MGKSNRPTPTHSTQPTLANHFAPLASNAEHAATATPHSPLAPPRHSSSPDATVVDSCLDQPPTPPSASAASSTLIPSQEVIAFHTASADSLTSTPQSTLSSSPSPSSPSLSSTADNSTVTDEVVGGQPDNGNANNAAAMDDDGYTLQTRRTKKGKRKDPPPQPKPNSKPTISISRNTDKEDKRDSDGSPTCRRIRRRTSTPPATPTATTTHRSAASTARLSSSSPASSSSASVAATRPSTPVASLNAGASSTATVVGTAVAAAVARALQPHPDRVADIQQPIPARAFSATVVQPVAHQSLASNSPATRQRPTGNSAVQSSLQQQQQQRQQANDGNKQERLKAANVPTRLLEQCDIRPQSNTALVLTLRPTADLLPNARPAWAALRRPTGAGSASLTAVAELLTRLHVPLPTLPLLYGKHSTLDELAAELEQRASNAVSDNDGDSEATDWRAMLSSASTDDERGELLVERAAAITAATHDTTPYATWQRVLHPSSGNMTRRRAGGGNDSNGQPANDDDNNNSRNHNNTDNHCTLKLEFHSPLIRLAVEHHLRQQHAGVEAELVVEPYRRQLIAARVTGFPVGPIHPGRHELCNDVSELHGNWQLLRQYLLRVAPHCTPARTPEPPYNGLGVVDFVLEESKMIELYKLQDHDVQLRAEHGITRPLRLTYAVLRQSKHTACSRCFRPGHKERDCQQARPPPGTVICRACYKPGHLARDCTLPAAERHCRMCDKAGHYAAHCAMYRSSWVNVTPPPFKQQHPLQPAPRSSTAFIGNWAAAASGLRLEQPVEEPPQPQRPSQQSHRGAADSASLTGRRKKARLQPAQQQHADEDDDMQTNEQPQPRATSTTDVVLAALLSTLNTIQQNAAKQAEVMERMQRDAAEQVKQQAASQEKALASLATTITATLTTAIAQLLDRFMPSQQDKSKYGYRTDDNQPMAGLFPQHNSTTAAMMEHQPTTQSDKSTRPQPTASPATTAAAARATVDNHTAHCQIQMPLSNPSSPPVQLSGDYRHASLHIHNACPAREQPSPTDGAQQTGQQRAQLPPANGGQPAPTAVAPNEQ